MWFLLWLIACVDLSVPSRPALPVPVKSHVESPRCDLERRVELPEGIEVDSLIAGPLPHSALVITDDAAAILLVDDRVAGSVEAGASNAASFTQDGSAVVLGSGSIVRAMSGDRLILQHEQDLGAWFGKGAWSIVSIAHAPDKDMFVAANPSQGGNGRVLRLRTTPDGWELVAAWPKAASGVLGALAVGEERVAVVVGDETSDRVQLFDRALTPLRVVRPARPARIGRHMGLVGQGVVLGLSDGSVLVDRPGSRDVQHPATEAPVGALEVVGDRVYVVWGGDDGSHAASYRAQGTRLIPEQSWDAPVVGLHGRADRVVVALAQSRLQVQDQGPEKTQVCDVDAAGLWGLTLLTGGDVRAVLQPPNLEGTASSERWWAGY